MTDDELEKRGEKFFNKLHPEDKEALKWFLTGQIQNILANEHGIGGSKGIAQQVRTRADERIQQLITEDEFMERLAQRLADKHGSRVNYPKMINDAVERTVNAYCAKAAGDAAARVKVHVYIEPDPSEPEEATNYGKF